MYLLACNIISYTAGIPAVCPAVYILGNTMDDFNECVIPVSYGDHTFFHIADAMHCEALKTPQRPRGCGLSPGQELSYKDKKHLPDGSAHARWHEPIFAGQAVSASYE